MLPSWERILYFHIQPALIDSLLSLAAVLLLLRLFRVRDPSIRAFFLFIPLVRPIFILLEGAARLERPGPPNMFFGLRIPDPFNMIPTDVTDENQLSTISQFIGVMVLVVIIVAVAFLAFRWLGFLIFYRRLRSSSSAIAAADGRKVELEGLIARMSAEIGIKRVPDVLLSTQGWTTPCAIGWRHPTVVIDPRLLEELDPEELRAVLAHELNHFRRRDGLWHWASVMLRDIQAFNPFSHLSISRLGLEREKACDRDAIVICDVPPRLLAECLVKVARLSAETDARPLPGYGVSLIKSDLSVIESRVTYLLGMKDDEIGHDLTGLKMRSGRKVALLGVWFIMASLQIYLCLWLGKYALVIK